MPLVETSGKLSYPQEIMLGLFRSAYKCFSEWHDRVFFYMCMEDPRLWNPVFGFEYVTNEDFETAMKSSYMDKIRSAGGQDDFLTEPGG